MVVKALSREEIMSLKQQYTPGTRIKLLDMEGEKNPPAGTKGTVMGVDDIGNIMVSWDNGSQLHVIPEVDNIEVLTTNDMMFMCGEIVSHFKRSMISPEDLAKEPNKHLYRVVSPAVINTETDDIMIVYQALYAPFLTFARPVDMAKELVDWSKYPYVPVHDRQAYRLMEYDLSKIIKEGNR